MNITKNIENGHWVIDGTDTITLVKQSDTKTVSPCMINVDIDKQSMNVDLCNITSIYYKTKRDAIIPLMSILGYGKFITKVIKSILWFF